MRNSWFYNRVGNTYRTSDRLVTTEHTVRCIPTWIFSLLSTLNYVPLRLQYKHPLHGGNFSNTYYPVSANILRPCCHIKLAMKMVLNSA